MSVRVRRARSAAEVLALAEPHEPAATMLVGPVMDHGLRRGVRAYVAEHDDGRPAGVLVVHRLLRDRWFAEPLLLDDGAAAPALAGVVDRSPAAYLQGTRRNAGPVLDAARRGGRVTEMEFTAVRARKAAMEQIPPQVPEDASRLASPADLDALVELYRHYELDFATTVPRLRASLRAALAARRVLLVEQEGRIAGAYRADAMTRRYAFWSGMTVDPDFRGRGLGADLGLRSGAWTTYAGLGIIATRHPSNPVPPASPEGTAPLLEGSPLELLSDVWVQARLRPRLRGLGRVHHALERVEGRIEPRRPVDVDPDRWKARWATLDERRARLGLGPRRDRDGLR